MGHHPYADSTTARRELLLDSVEVLKEVPGLVKLNIHAVLLEVFEMRDAAVRQADALTSIARDLNKLANPLMVAQSELPLRTGGILPPETPNVTLAPLHGGGVVVPRGQT